MRGARAWPGTFDAVGDLLPPAGAIDAYGDRIPVPLRAVRPRPEETAPRRAECPRRCPRPVRAAGVCDACLHRDEWKAGVDRAQVFRVGGHHGVPLLLRQQGDVNINDVPVPAASAE